MEQEGHDIMMAGSERVSWGFMYLVLHLYRSSLEVALFTFLLFQT